MPLTCSLRRLVCFTLAAAALGAVSPVAGEVSETRLTPVVRAVRSASPAVVNIQGQKVVSSQPGADAGRPVNGMGTGVVIDPRGYILTNFHVVDGVRQINVTLSDRRAFTARLVAHDRRTDLAVIKIRTAGRDLPTIPIGTSSDLMTGESVIAVGNAFGYEHTVTRGIISSLHRDVQVSDTQSYEDLIQTDASINPGNSGGPLLSVEGRMIGLNVAVRAGAQGIGFAIPVDMAMEVAARIMSVERLERKWHGLQTAALPESGELIVRRVLGGSPAQQSGLKAGDIITQIGGALAERPLDVELAMLGRQTGSRVPVVVQREEERLEMTLAVAPRGKRLAAASREPARRKAAEAADRSSGEEAWDALGMELRVEPRSTLSRRKTRYRGGMRVVRVRPGGPADQQGIVAGDILVGMHRWETASEQDIRYIVSRSNVAELGPVKFYLLRGSETLYGHMTVAARDTETASR